MISLHFVCHNVDESVSRHFIAVVVGILALYWCSDVCDDNIVISHFC